MMRDITGACLNPWPEQQEQMRIFLELSVQSTIK
jgi:hypothetical protein